MGASLHVFTYKDGLLARLAHDLRLHLDAFEVELAEGEVRATFQLASLHVDGVMRDGALDTDELSPRDREQILEHAREDVLQVADYPEARLEGRLSEGSPAALTGTLTLRGRSEPQEIQLELSEAEAVARARLVPSRWGIRPFKGLAGAIKLQDAIDIELRLSRPAGVEGDWARVRHRFGGGQPPGGG